MNIFYMHHYFINVSRSNYETVDMFEENLCSLITIVPRFSEVGCGRQRKYANYDMVYIADI